MRNNSGNLFSVNMKNVSKNKEYNVAVDVIIIIIVFLYYLITIASISLIEEMNKSPPNIYKIELVLTVILLVSIALKYSIGLGLIMALLLIFTMVFRRYIAKYLWNYFFAIKFSNIYPRFKDQDKEEKTKFKGQDKEKKTKRECPKLSIDINSQFTEEEFRLVHQLVLCDMDQYSKCLMLGIDINNPNSNYNRKIRKRYHPDLKKNYEKLNITYDEMLEVSKYIGGCINEQL